MSIFGAIQLTDVPGGSGGPLQPGQAVNGLSIDALGRAVLGQDTGAAGDPAKLLSERQVPMQGFNILFPTGFGNEIALMGDNSSLLRLKRGASPSPFLVDIVTSPSPGPGQNGDFWITIDEGFTNPDGQIDAVMQWGYNQSGAGGPHKLDEPAMWIAFESHFQQGGGTQMEWHLQSASTSGNLNRHISITPNIVTGDAIGFSQINSYFWQKCNDPLIYFGVDDTGNMKLSGPATLVEWSNTDPTFGQLQFSFQALGQVTIFNASTGPDNFIGFANPLSVQNSNPNLPSIVMPLINTPNATAIQIEGTVTGNAFPIFTSMDVSGGLLNRFENTHVGGDAGTFVLTAMNPGGPGIAGSKWAFNNAGAFEGYAAGIDQGAGNNFKIVYGTGTLVTDPAIMTLTPTQQAGFGGMTAPTAWVHINASGGAPGTGPLKLTAAPLLAVPEDGLIEYDGVNFYKTIGAVRSIIA